MFVPLGDLPGGAFRSFASAVSDDGSTVVGDSETESCFGLSDNEAFRWTAGGMAGLGFLPSSGPCDRSAAEAVSADGSTVAGVATRDVAGLGLRGEATLWRGGSAVGLGDLPGGDFDSRALDVSADGSVAVGYSQSEAGSQAFRWTPGDGMVGLGFLPGGESQSQANGVSTDGTTIVGESGSTSGFEAFRWTLADGMVGLGDLPGGSFGSSAQDVSADGSAIVGFAQSAAGTEAFLWKEGVMIGLGSLPGGGFSSFAKAVSADGSTVVGVTAAASGTTGEAFIWDSATGMRELDQVLTTLGLGPQLAGWTLRDATGISADGRVIVGYGINPNGDFEAWLAMIPEPGTGLLVTAGLLWLAARRERRA